MEYNHQDDDDLGHFMSYDDNQFPDHHQVSTDLKDFNHHPNCNSSTSQGFSSPNHDDLMLHGNKIPDSSEDGASATRSETDSGSKVAFRTRTHLEALYDGFKWRKYGKKKVKNNPNPRNYFKCTSGGCSVKKRIERDGEDSSFLITTYEGRHNHPSLSDAHDKLN